MQVNVFLPSDLHQANVLRAFAEGSGATVISNRKYRPCDVAVIFGLPKRALPATMWKEEITKRHSGRSLIVIDSAPVKRGEYWAVGYGGIGGRADFRHDKKYTSNNERWRSLDVYVAPWQDKPDGRIVVCSQLPHDANVQDTPHLDWCKTTFRLLNERCNNVVFRPHPRSNHKTYPIDELLHDNRPLDVLFKETRCVVTWNSTIATDAVLAGVPAVAMDIGSFAQSVSTSFGSLFDVNSKLSMPERIPWLSALAWSIWNINELRSGEAWEHLSG